MPATEVTPSPEVIKPSAVIPPPPNLPRLVITVPAVPTKPRPREVRKKITLSVNPNSTVPSKVPPGSTPTLRQPSNLERLLNRRRARQYFTGLLKEDSEIPKDFPASKRQRQSTRSNRPLGNIAYAVADLHKVIAQPLRAPFFPTPASGELELRAQFESLCRTSRPGAQEEYNSRAADKRSLALTAVTYLVSEQCYLLDCTLAHVSLIHVYQLLVRAQLKELRLQLSDLRARTKNLCELTAKYRHCELTARGDGTALHSAISQLWETKTVAREALTRLEQEKARQSDGTKTQDRQSDGTKTQAQSKDRL